jgi:uncharacterized protein YeeX (DUF496 family)
MTAEKANTNLYTQTQKNLSDYDRHLRRHPARRKKTLHDAIKYIKSKQTSPDIADRVIKQLSSYPSSVIDAMFPRIDEFLRNADLQISAEQANITNRIKKVKEKKEVIDAGSLLEDLHGDLLDDKNEAEDLVPDQQDQLNEKQEITELPIPEINPETFSPNGDEEF